MYKGKGTKMMVYNMKRCPKTKDGEKRIEGKKHKKEDTCCEILKYSQVYELYQSIVGQERGRTHRDLNERRKIKSNLNQINPNLV